jgi:hypothetical protein
MGITSKPARTAAPKASEQDIGAFISKAPDAKEQGAAPAPASAPAAAPAAAPARSPAAAPASTRKQPISLTIAPALLARVDEAAVRLGLSRAAAVALALSRFVEAEGAR